MDGRQDSDIDDDFSEIYKEYTGPHGSAAPKAQERTTINKRPHTGSDEEEEARDPNAVPTDFTSREAKVWEAKSKATERNWKKRKEEELICKICGESGHFTQGCPSTLGANRKSQDFFERVPARENHVKALFTEKVVTQIEKDIGCKIKIEDKFIIVSGKDRLILKKGVDAVHKVKEEGEKKASSSSHISMSRTPEHRSPVSSRIVHSELQRSNHSPHRPSQFHPRSARQEKIIEDRFHEDVQNISRGSPQARAYGSDGARGRSSHSRSPARRSFLANSYNSRDGHSQSRGAYRTDGWNAEPRLSDMKSGHNVEYPAFLQTLEEIELEYRREADDLGRIRDKEEDEENHKHREVVREIRENYMKNLGILRGAYAKQREEFVQRDAQRRLQQANQHMPTSGFGHPYNQTGYPEYENSAGNAHYSGPNMPMDSRSRYPNPMESYPPSRPHDNYGDFRQRRNDFGKTFNRF
ncbi:uncharacterized protein LOC116002250 isoform X1 [Ipomoea triloba]|uniref:uncharacterized protein LOC116002250 isoform X1 n=1 Tax=Ipomoea triloba TaxID=35885 RepID=UPI00125DC9C3|nr:uncharacterized protein LOC116002250 isoform X1 [Ipomoea triloba]XP_031098215.1 uncharacterized protein LOC116002250 isoform X1 [Ipomoea triloba]